MTNQRRLSLKSSFYNEGKKRENVFFVCFPGVNVMITIFDNFSLFSLIFAHFRRFLPFLAIFANFGLFSRILQQFSPIFDKFAYFGRFSAKQLPFAKLLQRWKLDFGRFFFSVLRGSSSALGLAGVHVQVLPLHADPQRQRQHLHPRRHLTGQVRRHGFHL
jgi:hypothetical protein